MSVLSRACDAGLSVTMIGDDVFVTGQDAALNLMLPLLKAHKQGIAAELHRQLAAVSDWLAKIGETDQAAIDEILSDFRTNPERRALLLAETGYRQDSFSGYAATPPRNIVPGIKDLPTLKEDVAFIRSRLGGMSDDDQDAALREYRRHWLAAAAAEPLPHRQDNTGRRAANTFLNMIYFHN